MKTSSPFSWLDLLNRVRIGRTAYKDHRAVRGTKEPPHSPDRDWIRGTILRNGTLTYLDLHLEGARPFMRRIPTWYPFTASNLTRLAFDRFTKASSGIHHCCLRENRTQCNPIRTWYDTTSQVVAPENGLRWRRGRVLEHQEPQGLEALTLRQVA